MHHNKQIWEHRLNAFLGDKIKFEDSSAVFGTRSKNVLGDSSDAGLRNIITESQNQDPPGNNNVPLGRRVDRNPKNHAVAVTGFRNIEIQNQNPPGNTSMDNPPGNNPNVVTKIGRTESQIQNPQGR
ncbi:hypothetical protein K435DRAFT_807721 [Dendrothele bispora CBS 962.96]|uniref:Uncharacterized protein n=1 Tax=Dendrothele bispora (strain CBS 962.96) TaxID=1314807 RepID=A0A4S8L3R8_DENBC|nr:hypothetical protein K435DRAFT_807721 [Dendrothele bispora CBS 962.96]